MQGAEHDFERWRAHGEADALARVFDATAPGLLRFAMHLVGDASTAEDLVQETFLTALRRADAYEAGRPVERWLAGILARHAQELRRDARRATDEIPERVDASTPLDALLSGEQRDVLARALDRLAEPYRTPAVLHYLNGLSPAAVAHALGRSPGAVRVQLHRARALLEHALPAGIAGALLALALPARGLGSVRNQVLEHAAQLAPAAAVSGGVFVGALVMKKVVVAAALVLALAAALWWSQRPADVVAVAENTSALEVARLDVASEDARAEPLAPRVDAERAPAAATAPAAAAQLVPFPVRVVDGESGLPVAGVRLAFFPPKRGTWSELRARWPERFFVDARGNERVHDWPWFRAKPTPRERLDVDPITSYEGPLPGETPVATAVSDAQGQAVVELGPEQAFVVAEHPSYATRGMPPELERTVNWSDGKVSRVDTFRDELLVVKLHRPRVLRGQLIDLEGRPLAERIALQVQGHVEGDMLPTGWRAFVPSGVWTVWTNPDGSFEAEIAAKQVSVNTLDASWSVARTALHPVTKAEWNQWGAYAVDGELAWIPLRRNPVVLVRAGPDDAPVRDFRMLVLTLENKWPRGLMARVRSEDGRVALLDSGDFERWSRTVGPLGIHVLADGFAPGYVECAEPTKAGEIVVRLLPGACPPITGTVLDDGRPVAGASVQLASSNRENWNCDLEIHRPSIAASTDEHGRFSVCAPAGGWLVNVAHGSRSQCRFIEHPAAEPLAIDLGRDTVVEFVVDAPPGTKFEEMYATLYSGREVNQALEIDAHGRARFGSLPAGRYTALVAGPDGRLEPAPGDDEFDLAADATRTLHFRLGPANGPRHARLVVDGLATLEGWTAQAWTSHAIKVAVEPDGLVPLDVGYIPSQLRIAAPDGSTYLFRVPFEAAGEPVLRIARGRAGVNGRLVRADGRPRTNRRILAWTRGDEHGLDRIETPVDREGRFRFDALMPGAVTLSVCSEHGQEDYDGLDSTRFIGRAEAGAPARELVIQLPAGVDPAIAGGRMVLSGVARDGDGPAAGRNLWITALFDSADGTLQVTTSTTVLSDGTYVLPTLPAVRHLAMSWFEGGRNWTQEFTLPLDVAQARQDFALR